MTKYTEKYLKYKEKYLKLKEQYGGLGFNIDDNIVINYDTGNSASLGFNSKEELTMTGKYIKNIHIKDRKLHGGTVPFGQGDVNFDLFFSTLNDIEYKGDLILQGARVENENPEITITKYRDFILKYIERYF